MSSDSLLICQWCSERFKARRGGSPQRFCSVRCRTGFWSALRRAGERALATGLVSIDALRNGRSEACTLEGMQEAVPQYPEIGSTRRPPAEPPKRFAVEVPQDLLAALVFRHHEIRFSEQDDVAAVLSALARLGHKPKITETPEHVKVLSF